MTDTLTRDPMAADAPPEGYATACPACGATAGKGGKAFSSEQAVAQHLRTCGGVPPEGGSTPVLELTAAEKKLVVELKQATAMPVMLLMAINMTDGLLVINGEEQLFETLVLASRKNKKLKEFLSSVVEGVIWLALGTAVANIVLPILDNHGILSVPTMRVSDKLGGGGLGGSTTGTPPTAPAGGTPPPSPAGPPGPRGPAGGAGAGLRLPPNSAIPDMRAGVNRAARRAVEPDGPSIPPDLRAIMEREGISESDLDDVARRFGLG